MTYTEFIMNIVMKPIPDINESFVELDRDEFKEDNDPIVIIYDLFKDKYNSKNNDWTDEKLNYFKNISSSIINFIITLSKDNNIKWTNFIYNELVLLVENYVDKTYPNYNENEFDKLKVSIKKMCGLSNNMFGWLDYLFYTLEDLKCRFYSTKKYSRFARFRACKL